MPPVAPFPHAGELAALGTAGCWVASVLAFEAAGRRVGSLTVNLIRLVMAIALGTLAGWALRGLPLPTDATAHAWLWLSISGLVGFTFGDLCLFRAFVVLGARLSSLMMSLVPPLTAVIGWALLGEVLGGRDLLGMAMTVGGVVWALSERMRRTGGRSAARPGAAAAAPAPPATPAGPTAWGIALGLGGALGQAGGLVLSKLGMGGYDPFAATQIRVLAGTAGYVLLFTALGRWGRVVRATADRPAMVHTATGAFFGPFLGVSLSLLAVQHTLTGVAASIMSITPVLIIPAVVLLRRERVGPGGWLGAALAVAGVAVLFR